MPCSHITRLINRDPVWFQIFVRRFMHMLVESAMFFNFGEGSTWNLFSPDKTACIAFHGMMRGLIVECSFDPTYNLLVYISQESRFCWLVEPTMAFVWSYAYSAEQDAWNLVLVCNLSNGMPVWGVGRLRVKRIEWFCLQFTMLRPYELPEKAPFALQLGLPESRLRAFVLWCDSQDYSDSDADSDSTIPDDYFDIGIVPEELKTLHE